MIVYWNCLADVPLRYDSPIVHVDRTSFRTRFTNNYYPCRTLVILMLLRQWEKFLIIANKVLDVGICKCIVAYKGSQSCMFTTHTHVNGLKPSKYWVHHYEGSGRWGEREREIPVTKNVKLVNKICVRDNKGKRKLRSNLRLSKMIDWTHINTDNLVNTEAGENQVSLMKLAMTGIATVV